MVMIKPYQFNHRASFGTIESVVNRKTSGMKRGFVPQFSLWYAPRSRTINQVAQARQAGMVDTKTIAVRHNKKLIDSLMVEIEGVKYEIENISFNDNNAYLAYDFLTLKKLDAKVG